ncbi:MAG: glycine cleavage system protein GcvH [Candidatus Bathyarchaeia archaeon]
MVLIGEYEVADGLYYSQDHIWTKPEGQRLRIGITDYAQKMLRQIVFVDLPKPGVTVKQFEAFMTLESVKTAVDVVSPVSGTVAEVNSDLKANPESINNDPYGKGWLILVEPSSFQEELSNLMDFTKAVEWHKQLAE